MKKEQIPGIIDALLEANAQKRGGIEWINQDDNGLDVHGPDGVEGWFNDSKFNIAVQPFDPATVRKVVELFWLIERFQSNNLDKHDHLAMISFVELLKED
jgi:hypothetical protein